MFISVRFSGCALLDCQRKTPLLSAGLVDSCLFLDHILLLCSTSLARNIKIGYNDTTLHGKKVGAIPINIRSGVHI